ncbi:MAG: hypothetical protein MRY51_07540 [Flavobacteriaceae bacterium]|jgi:hypothetical protein|nr:hypothetical protein [Flavobacteriaceae bacterium LSUCC0859]MCI4642693.1 hypothetical protein [Flavobacteriaceae bacterium]MCI5088180.1 hypothetical protein [Flavobacteriaceae bacterium]CAI8218135.1 MAG: Uncharacterised protein [SAR116 cluster bacterium]
MKKILSLCILFVCFSCEEKQEEYTAATVNFEEISFLSRTNENVGAGTQFVYLSAGLTADDASYCFCQLTCERTAEVYFLLEYNKDTNILRFKKTASDPYTEYNTSNWCIRYN